MPGSARSIGAVAALSFLSLALLSGYSEAAPVYENEPSPLTHLDYYAAPESGCYYNFQHYEEGDRIITNEPCLNCTCHNRMLMCYLRVCPFSKGIGQDCTREKRPDQCCPVITCPEVPVELVTSSTTELTSSKPTHHHHHHHRPSGTAVGHPDNYGCTIDDTFYTDGAQVPGNPSKPCELCYCIRNRTACVMQECTLNVEGCLPVYQDGVCCPVRYDCDNYDETTELETSSTAGPTTIRPTGGLIFTTTPAGTMDCRYEDEIYGDGALISTKQPCEHCYCMKGDIVCAVQECGTPMEHVGKNCTALPPREGQCCPDQYQCEPEAEITTTISSQEAMHGESATSQPLESDNLLHGNHPYGSSDDNQQNEHISTDIPNELLNKPLEVTLPPKENDQNPNESEESVTKPEKEDENISHDKDEIITQHDTTEPQSLENLDITTETSTFTEGKPSGSKHPNIPLDINEETIMQDTVTEHSVNPDQVEYTTQFINAVTTKGDGTEHITPQESEDEKTTSEINKPVPDSDNVEVTESHETDIVTEQQLMIDTSTLEDNKLTTLANNDVTEKHKIEEDITTSYDLESTSKPANDIAEIEHNTLTPNHEQTTSHFTSSEQSSVNLQEFFNNDEIESTTLSHVNHLYTKNPTLAENERETSSSHESESTTLNHEDQETTIVTDQTTPKLIEKEQSSSVYSDMYSESTASHQDNEITTISSQETNQDSENEGSGDLSLLNNDVITEEQSTENTQTEKVTEEQHKLEDHTTEVIKTEEVTEEQHKLEDHTTEVIKTEDVTEEQHKLEDHTTEVIKTEEVTEEQHKLEDHTSEVIKTEEVTEEQHKLEDHTTEVIKTEEVTEEQHKLEDHTTENTQTEEVTEQHKLDDHTTEVIKTEEITEEQHKLEDHTTENTQNEEITEGQHKLEDHTTEVIKTEEITEEQHKLEDHTTEVIKTEEVTEEQHKLDEHTTEVIKTEEITEEQHKLEDHTTEVIKTEEVTEEQHKLEDHTTENTQTEEVTEQHKLDDHTSEVIKTEEITEEQHKLEDHTTEVIKTEEVTEEQHKLEDHTTENTQTEEVTEQHKLDDHTTEVIKTEEITEEQHKLEDHTTENTQNEEITEGQHKLEDHTTEVIKTEEITEEQHKLEDHTTEVIKTEEVTEEQHKLDEHTTEVIKTEEITEEQHKLEDHTTEVIKTEEVTEEQHKLEDHTTENIKTEEVNEEQHKLEDHTTDKHSNDETSENINVTNQDILTTTVEIVDSSVTSENVLHSDKIEPTTLNPTSEHNEVTISHNIHLSDVSEDPEVSTVKHEEHKYTSPPELGTTEIPEMIHVTVHDSSITHELEPMSQVVDQVSETDKNSDNVEHSYITTLSPNIEFIDKLDENTHDSTEKIQDVTKPQAYDDNVNNVEQNNEEHKHEQPLQSSSTTEPEKNEIHTNDYKEQEHSQNEATKHPGVENSEQENTYTTLQESEIHSSSTENLLEENPEIIKDQSLEEHIPEISSAEPETTTLSHHSTEHHIQHITEISSTEHETTTLFHHSTEHHVQHIPQVEEEVKNEIIPENTSNLSEGVTTEKLEVILHNTEQPDVTVVQNVEDHTLNEIISSTNFQEAINQQQITTDISKNENYYTTKHPLENLTGGLTTNIYSTEEPIKGPNGIIPGEGMCLIDGITYPNNSPVPSQKPCHQACHCRNSVIHCLLVECPPPPENIHKCMPIKTQSDQCCPIYICDEIKKPNLESENQVANEDLSTINQEYSTSKTPIGNLDEQINEDEASNTTPTIKEKDTTKIPEEPTTLKIPITEDVKIPLNDNKQEVISDIFSTTEGHDLTTKYIYEHGITSEVPNENEKDNSQKIISQNENKYESTTITLEENEHTTNKEDEFFQHSTKEVPHPVYHHSSTIKSIEDEPEVISEKINEQTTQEPNKIEEISTIKETSLGIELENSENEPSANDHTLNIIPEIEMSTNVNKETYHTTTSNIEINDEDHSIVTENPILDEHITSPRVEIIDSGSDVTSPKIEISEDDIVTTLSSIENEDSNISSLPSLDVDPDNNKHNINDETPNKTEINTEPNESFSVSSSLPEDLEITSPSIEMIVTSQKQDHVEIVTTTETNDKESSNDITTPKSDLNIHSDGTTIDIIETSSIKVEANEEFTTLKDSIEHEHSDPSIQHSNSQPISESSVSNEEITQSIEEIEVTTTKLHYDVSTTLNEIIYDNIDNEKSTQSPEISFSTSDKNVNDITTTKAVEDQSIIHLTSSKPEIPESDEQVTTSQSEQHNPDDALQNPIQNEEINKTGTLEQTNDKEEETQHNSGEHVPENDIKHETIPQNEDTPITTHETPKDDDHLPEITTEHLKENDETTKINIQDISNEEKLTSLTPELTSYGPEGHKESVEITTILNKVDETEKIPENDELLQNHEEHEVPSFTLKPIGFDNEITTEYTQLIEHLDTSQETHIDSDNLENNEITTIKTHFETTLNLEHQSSISHETSHVTTEINQDHSSPHEHSNDNANSITTQSSQGIYSTENNLATSEISEHYNQESSSIKPIHENPILESSTLSILENDNITEKINNIESTTYAPEEIPHDHHKNDVTHSSEITTIETTHSPNTESDSIEVTSESDDQVISHVTQEILEINPNEATTLSPIHTENENNDQALNKITTKDPELLHEVTSEQSQVQDHNEKDDTSHGPNEEEKPEIPDSTYIPETGDLTTEKPTTVAHMSSSQFYSDREQTTIQNLNSSPNENLHLTELENDEIQPTISSLPDDNMEEYSTTQGSILNEVNKDVSNVNTSPSSILNETEKVNQNDIISSTELPQFVVTEEGIIFTTAKPSLFENTSPGVATSTSTNYEEDIEQENEHEDEGYLPSEYGDANEDAEQQAFGPGTCRYGGKVYVSAQQIPRNDPCDFCFCFRSDIICLQQSCPPPIKGCFEEPIDGFCCPRYECPVSMALSMNVSTTTTTTTTTLPPHFASHAVKGTAKRTGCLIRGRAYQVGQRIPSASGPCMNCICGSDGQMQCDPKPCSPEPMLRQMIMGVPRRR